MEDAICVAVVVPAPEDVVAVALVLGELAEPVLDEDSPEAELDEEPADEEAVDEEPVEVDPADDELEVWTPELLDDVVGFGAVAALLVVAVAVPLLLVLTPEEVEELLRVVDVVPDPELVGPDGVDDEEVTGAEEDVDEGGTVPWVR